MTWLRNTLLAAALVGGTLMALPTLAQADEYWDGYWGWYDNTYSPGYARYYTYSRPYSGAYYSQPYYGGNYYYSQPYYGRYYGAPGVGYTNFGYGRGAVNVGPVRFGWR
jgi:hypothetical protein